MLISRYHTVANLLILSLVIYSSVDIYYALRGPDPKLTRGRPPRITTEHLRDTAPRDNRQPFDHYLEAINRDLFGAVQEEPVDSSVELEIEDLRPTALNIALLGTVSGDPEDAMAVIKEVSKRTECLYREGDTIQNATILKILRGKVILRVGDKNQILTMEEKPRPSKSSKSTKKRLSGDTQSQPPPARGLDRSLVSNLPQDVRELTKQVNLRPHYKDGKVDGLVIGQARRGTVFTRIGLRKGDVVHSVNGNSVTTPYHMIEFCKELESGSSVSLEISRRGKSKTLTYTFR